ncbi:hypothetical protein N7540_000141 [Penicillium herquei]|nr:hypothetical protein N7540_000141 [Penicillium herquei]
MGASRRIFVAVAIGKKVRFYRFDGRAENIRDEMYQLHENTIDIDAVNGMVEVENSLGHVKANGWERANS